MHRFYLFYKKLEKYTKTVEVNNDTHVYRLLYGSYLILKL